MNGMAFLRESRIFSSFFDGLFLKIKALFDRLKAAGVKFVCWGDIIQLAVEPRDSLFKSLDTGNIMLELIV